MNMNLETNINNLNYILYMQSKSGNDNGETKDNLEKEQTTLRRKCRYKKIIS